MTKAVSARFALREATAAAHERVDSLFSALDLADPHAYRTFLAAQAAAHIPVEEAIEANGIEALLPDWPERRRAPLIRNDLGALGVPEPPLESPPELSGEAAMLGAAYVLEGSRLGGQLLHRSVAPGLPSSFLAASSPSAWRALVSALDDRLAIRKDIDAAISAACDVFSTFERSGRRYILG